MQFYETVYGCHFMLVLLMTVIGIIFLKYPSKVSLFSVIEFFFFSLTFLSSLPEGRQNKYTKAGRFVRGKPCLGRK